MNQQPIEKRDPDGLGFLLDVHSIFHTIQGEGPYTGVPAVFVRLAGCNLQCPLCDTDYTTGRSVYTLDRLTADICKLMPMYVRHQLVVITGGEPLRQKLEPLCSRLTRLGFIVQIETNGTLDIPFELAELVETQVLFKPKVYIVCSPKTGKVSPGVGAMAYAFKYVARADDILEDGLPGTALEHSAHPYLARPHGVALVYLQPADEKDGKLNAANTDACVQSCLKHGHILQLQLHKIINVE